MRHAGKDWGLGQEDLVNVSEGRLLPRKSQLQLQGGMVIDLQPKVESIVY